MGVLLDRGLERVGERVDAGVGGEAQRLGEGQLIIYDRERRQIGEACAQHLLVVRLVGDDGEARRLRSGARRGRNGDDRRSGEHTSELQSLMRKSYAVFCLKTKKL